MVDFDYLTRLYLCQERAEIHQIAIECPQLERIEKAKSILFNKEIDTEFWHPVIGDIRRFIFLSLVLPLPHDHPFLKFTGTSISTLNRGTLAYPSISADFLSIYDLCGQLQKSSSNPLLEEITNIIQPSHAILVVPRSNWVAPLEEYFQTIHYPLKVDSQSTVNRNNTIWNNMVICGPVGAYDESIYTVRRADTISWLTFSWKPLRFTSKVEFIDYSHLGTTLQAISSHGAQSVPKRGFPDLTMHELYSEENQPSAHREDSVPARSVWLADEGLIYVNANLRARSWILDTVSMPPRARQVLSDDLMPGQFLIVRTHGGGDLIVPVADSILGPDHVFLRKNLALWKQTMAHFISENGLSQTAALLQSNGASRLATPNNLKYWISPLSIAPSSKLDFKALLKPLGLDSRSDNWWRESRRIKSAHMAAGSRIRKWLLEQASTLTDRDFRDGRIELKMPEEKIASAAAIEIEHVSTTIVNIPGHLIGVYQEGNPIWQE